MAQSWADPIRSMKELEFRLPEYRSGHSVPGNELLPPGAGFWVPSGPLGVGGVGVAEASKIPAWSEACVICAGFSS